MKATEKNITISYLLIKNIFRWILNFQLFCQACLPQGLRKLHCLEINI